MGKFYWNNVGGSDPVSFSEKLANLAQTYRSKGMIGQLQITFGPYNFHGNGVFSADVLSIPTRWYAGMLVRP
jgi:hypothetical protein